MGQGGTTKAVLCFTIIHLGPGSGRGGKGRKEERIHVYNKGKKKNQEHCDPNHTVPLLAWDYKPSHFVLLNFSIVKKELRQVPDGRKTCSYCNS